MNNHNWQPATLVARKMVAEDVMSLSFQFEKKLEFQSGQHMDIRLTAPDGYQAERSYSIANAPENNEVIELGVQLLENGEVSPYLYKMAIDKQIELRGPIGGHFIWNVNSADVAGRHSPLILIGGGSGMVPLISMVRHHVNNLNPSSSDSGEAKEAKRDIIFIVSARTLGHVLYKDELEEIQKKDPRIKIVVTITDGAPAGWTGYSRRIDKPMLEEIFGTIQTKNPQTYICGPNPFVAAITKHMLGLGFNSTTIKTERFGG